MLFYWFQEVFPREFLANLFPRTHLNITPEIFEEKLLRIALEFYL